MDEELLDLLPDDKVPELKEELSGPLMSNMIID